MSQGAVLIGSQICVFFFVCFLGDFKINICTWGLRVFIFVLFCVINLEKGQKRKDVAPETPPVKEELI